jgi:hypothetical protein
MSRTHDEGESKNYRHDDLLASINAKLRTFAESLTSRELAFLAEEKMTYLDDPLSGVRVWAGDRRLNG